MTVTELLSAFALPHALMGTVALATFWTAAFANKGSTLHRLVGRTYLLAMIGVLATAIPLALSQALQGQWVGATFLAYLVILVAYACRCAWTAIRWKHDFARYTGTGLRVSAALLTAAGLAVTALGVAFEAWLLIIFGLIGPLSALSARSLIRNGPRSPRWWLKEHYGAMIANGVATHIAFLQIGLIRLLPDLGTGMVQNLAWFGPLALSFVAARWLNRRYMRPRSMQAAPAASAPARRV